jgi:hypothetical protein
VPEFKVQFYCPPQNTHFVTVEPYSPATKNMIFKNPIEKEKAKKPANELSVPSQELDEKIIKLKNVDHN